MGICCSKDNSKKAKYAEEEKIVRSKTSHVVAHKGPVTQKYILNKILGKGGFGQVWRASLKDDPTIKRAVKIIQKDRTDAEEI